LSNADQNEHEELFRFFETSAGFDPYLACEKSRPQFTVLLCAVGFLALGMKTLGLSSLFACLLILTQLNEAQEPNKSAQQPETPNPLAEKIRDISPDKKFAMRISYDAQKYRQMFPAAKSDAGKASAALQRGIKEEYFSATIKAIELVSLPQKLVVAELPWDGSADQTSLTWSRDSRWCAFYAETARWGLTWIYHLRDNKFVPLSEKGQLGVDVESSARETWGTPLEVDEEDNELRREWLKPIRWVKPGVLLLEQSLIFRGFDAGEATYRLTAAFDEKTGKFRIISKKKVPSKE
jgi:hypothetical protein